jgi:RNA polymerase sigma-70 factor (ECF subfamily)
MSPSRTSQATDEQLMRRVQRDDVDAFEQLFDRHAGRALRVARSVCRDGGHAEDAVQEGFLSIWRSRTKYRPDMGSFRAWSMSVVRNRAVDATRRSRAAHRPRTVNIDTIAELRETTHPSPVDQAIRQTDTEALRAALSRLPDAQAEVITLAYYGELTHTEIATRLAIPTGTVKGRMRLGLEKLRREINSATQPVRR